MSVVLSAKVYEELMLRAKFIVEHVQSHGPSIRLLDEAVKAAEVDVSDFREAANEWARDNYQSDSEPLRLE